MVTDEAGFPVAERERVAESRCVTRSYLLILCNAVTGKVGGREDRGEDATDTNMQKGRDETKLLLQGQRLLVFLFSLHAKAIHSPSSSATAASSSLFCSSTN